MEQTKIRKEDEDDLRALHAIIDSVTALILSNKTEEAVMVTDISRSRQRIRDTGLPFPIEQKGPIGDRDNL